MATGSFIGGEWRNGSPLEVTNKYSGEVIGTVATASPSDVDAALASASARRRGDGRAARPQAVDILSKMSSLLARAAGAFARSIAAEAGKAIKLARVEVDRARDDVPARGRGGPADPRRDDRARRRAIGRGLLRVLVAQARSAWSAAITPFNFPLNLVAHKVAPAHRVGQRDSSSSPPSRRR